MSEEQKLAAFLAGPGKPSTTEAEPTEELETVDKAEEEPEGHRPVSISTVTKGNLFRHPDVHPIVLDLCLIRKYGYEWYGWEPETLQLRIPQDFHVTEVSDLAFSKIQACKTLHLVDTFWQQWEIFGWVTMALNGIFPDFEVMQVPTVTQCLISVDIANQLRDDVSWSTEVTAYLEMVHQHDGVLVPQPPLEFLHVETEDTVVEPKDIRMLWPAVRTSNQMPTGDTVTAEQLRRMLLSYRGLEASRVSLRSQLPLVQHV